MARQVTEATISDFRGEFPEFTDTVISDIEVDKFLRRAKRLHTATKAGTLYAAAHLYCLDKAAKGETGGSADGGMGVITKETIGPKSVEYMTAAGSATQGEPRKVFWATTPYGREFMVIEQRNVRQGFGILIG